MVKPVAPVPPQQPRPPLGLRPRHSVEPSEPATARRREILAAMTRYSEADMRIPSPWLMELIELNSQK